MDSDHGKPNKVTLRAHDHRRQLNYRLPAHPDRQLETTTSWCHNPLKVLKTVPTDTAYLRRPPIFGAFWLVLSASLESASPHRLPLDSWRAQAARQSNSLHLRSPI